MLIRSLNISRPVKDDSNLNHPNLDDIDLQKNLSVTMRSSIEFMAQNICHPFGFGNVSKGTHQLVDVTAFKHKVEVFHDSLVAVQMFGNIKHGQIGNFNFISHLLILKHRSQALRVGNIGLLACFITAAKHDNHHIAALNVIHSPTTTKMLTHFKNAFANGLYIAKIAMLNSFKPSRQTTMHNTVFKIVKPLAEFGKLSNRDFHALHLNKHKMNLTHHNNQTKMTAPRNEGVDCNSRVHGDKPHLLAVFFCPSFLAQRKFASCEFIMTVLFGKPLRLVAPCSDIADPSNTVTRYSAKSCDGFTHSIHGIHQ